MDYFDDLRIYSVSKCITRKNGVPGKNEFLVIGLMLRGPAILCTQEQSRLLQTPFLYWSQGNSKNSSYWRTPPGVERENMWILGGGSRFKRMVESLNALNCEAGYYYLKNSGSVAEVFERLRNSWERKNDSEKYRLPLLLEELMASIGEAAETTELSSKMSRLVKETALLMAASPEQDVNIDRIAHNAGISLDYFRHCFLRYIGASPHDYLLTQRYALAVRLLRESSMNISEISDMCGFSAQSLFTHFFKKRSGLSPKEFRKRIF